ncbi:MAG: glycoside hydrolase family 15 protein, partial [Bryobacteraceae bacterium]
DQDIGGYHLIWPRDMVQAAMGKLACGDAVSARRAWFYLTCTQEQQGNWTQNMWLDGTPNWTGIQMDATGYGILLADALRRAGEFESHTDWQAVRKAAGFLVRNGPVTDQERWEENAGYSPNTMAIEVAALLAAADFAEQHKQTGMAEFLSATADAWNEAIDELTYADGTELAREFEVDGYYIRIAPREAIETGLQESTTIRLKNLPDEDREKRAPDVISPDALSLVRFGLRAANDPRIVATVKLIDALTRTETSAGPVWRRYTGDGYGESADGSPFRDRGQGRGWPLLAGERAHYEIACGNLREAKRLARVIAAQTSECGLIPEQVWDAADLPERELWNGRPTGSGMPLVWAHAELIKLLRSIRERKIWDMPPQPVERYQKQKKTANFQIWTKSQQRRHLKRGKALRVDLPEAARIRWSTDDWQTTQECETTDSQLGLHYAVLPVADAAPGTQIRFTFYWTERKEWEGQNFEVNTL